MAPRRAGRRGSPAVSPMPWTARSRPPARPCSRWSGSTPTIPVIEPADVLLADGSTVHLRPIRPEDAGAIVALHSRFSVRTRYLRYFSPYPRIPERDLARFVNVDHRDREALVVSAG